MLRAASGALGGRSTFLRLLLAVACLWALPAWAQESSPSAESAPPPLESDAAESLSAEVAPADDAESVESLRPGEADRLAREREVRLDLPSDGASAGQADEPRERSAFLRLIDALIRLGLVVGVIYGIYWLAKWMRKEPIGLRRGEGDFVHILETTRLTADKSLHVVSVGSRVLLVASGPQGVVFLAEIDDEEIAGAAARARRATGFAGDLERAEREFGLEEAGEDEESGPVEPLKRALAALSAIGRRTRGGGR